MPTDFSFLGANVNESTAMPKEFYTDPAVFETEKKTVLSKGWIAVARADQLPNPGDYITCDFFDSNIIVVRDKTGAINAFSNTCLHRASRIVSGSGHCQNFLVCPYHKWSYELDGKLHAASSMDQAIAFDRTDKRLPQVCVEQWQGWVFVNSDPNAQALAPGLTELSDLLDQWNVADMKHVGTLHYDSPWNWKVMVDNFMESYHHMGIHPETLNSAYPFSGTHRERGNENYTLLENPSIDAATVPPFWVIDVFPSTMFALVRNADAPMLAWWQMTIKSHEYFDLDIQVMLPREVADNEDAVHGALTSLDQIHREDIPACTNVWKGLQNPLYTAGRLSHLEECLWDFYSYLQRALNK
jgi:phenylpropionate dioxygenase-like ring-hydroxylating dioxygenase large terminal subunit